MPARIRGSANTPLRAVSRRHAGSATRACRVSSQSSPLLQLSFFVLLNILFICIRHIIVQHIIVATFLYSYPTLWWSEWVMFDKPWMVICLGIRFVSSASPCSNRGHRFGKKKTRQNFSQQMSRREEDPAFVVWRTLPVTAGFTEC